MNANAILLYIVVVLVELSIQYNNAKTNDVLHEIGAQLCPHTRFCQRNATEYYTPGVFQRPCCSGCSCEDNCWETANCCPDKDVIETREPITTCASVIVKKAEGLRKERLGYNVIDYCPVDEKNDTLVSKCTVKNAKDFEELIWVSNGEDGTIYRNKFCAQCHLETSNVAEWSLEAKCTNDVYTSFDNLTTFLFSNKCQLIVREPYNLTNTNFTTCEVPDFTTCNETGLWKEYNADVMWACGAFEAPFFVRRLEGKDQFVMDAYRNVYCFICNTGRVQNTETLCPLPGYDPLDVNVFSSLVNYRRYEQANYDQEQSTIETNCKSYEIMDDIMNKCRLLNCPFGSTPVNGKCKPLFEGTTGLYIDIQFTLRVLWSQSEYKVMDKLDTLTSVGESIIDQFVNAARFDRNESRCPYCSIGLQMTADVNEQGKREDTDSKLDDNVKENSEQDNLDSEAQLPEFIINVVFFTVPECQLQNIFDIATGMFGRVIEIQLDDKSDMALEIGLLKDNSNQTFKVLKHMDSKLWNCKVNDAYELKDDKLCPKISIKYYEFEPYLTNENIDVIQSLFEQKHIETDEPTDVCIDTYYERFQSVNFHILSQGFATRTDARVCIGLMFLPNIVNMI